MMINGILALGMSKEDIMPVTVTLPPPLPYFQTKAWRQFGRDFRAIRKRRRRRMIDVARAGRVSVFTVLQMELGRKLDHETTLSIAKLLNLAHAIHSFPEIRSHGWKEEDPFVEFFKQQECVRLLEVNPIKRK